MCEVTFLCNRQQRKWSTYTLEISEPQRRSQLYVYSTKALKGGRISSRSVPDNGLEKAIEETAQYVKEQGAGMLVAFLGDERKLRIHPCHVAANKAAEKFGVLQPGRRLQIEEIGKDWKEMPAGAHIFVPVYKEDEEALDQFATGLGRLPSDMEAVVLYALRRPNLETRVDRLEEELRSRSEPRAELVEGSRGLARWRYSLQGWSRQKVARGPLLASALAVAFVLNAFMIYKTAPAKPEQPSTQRPPWSWSRWWPWGEPAEDSASNLAALQSPIEGLLRAIQDYKSENRALTRVYKAQFKSFADDDEELADLLSEPSADRDRLILGLMRLQLLKVDPNTTDFGWLGETEEFDETEAVYRRLRSTLKNQAQDLEFLAFLSCQLNGAEPEDVPRLPPSEDGQQGLTLIPDAACRDFPVEEGKEELERLRQFVMAEPLSETPSEIVVTQETDEKGPAQSEVAPAPTPDQGQGHRETVRNTPAGNRGRKETTPTQRRDVRVSGQDKTTQAPDPKSADPEAAGKDSEEKKKLEQESGTNTAEVEETLPGEGGGGR